MKNVILVLLGLLTGSFSFGQGSKAQIELGKYDVIVDKIFVQDQGFILITGIPNQVGGKQNFDVHYFKADGSHAWVKPVKIEYGMKNRSTYTVVSPNGKSIYFIQMHAGGYYDKKHYISQFTIAGDEKTFVIDGKEDFGKELQSVFCDDNYLYYLATEDGNEYHDKKKASEKMLLTRFKSSDMSNQRITLNLPSLEASESNVYWSFIGQKEEEKFLAAKKIDFEGENKFTVVSFDSQGKTSAPTTLEMALMNDKFIRPSYTKESNAYSETVTDVNYTTVVSKSLAVPNIPSSTTVHLVPTTGGFSHILYSDLHDCFYVYGLFGPKPFRKIGPVYEGFYVYKFDRKGAPSWKIQEMGSKQLMDEGVFRVHGMPVDRNLKLIPGPGNNLAASISFRETIFPYAISSDGQVTPFDKKEADTDLSNTYLSSNGSKALAYIEKTGRDKKVTYTALRNTSNELLIKFDSKKSTIDVFSFTN